MDYYGRQGKLKATPGNGDQLETFLMEAAASMNEVKGCRLYLIGRDNNNSDIICITEVWDTKEDHGNSLKLDSVRQIIAKAMPYIDPVQEKSQEFTVTGGKGLTA